MPSELNFRANIHAFKLLGVERILSVSAVGSLKEEIEPLDIVLPDQFVDRTRGRISSFFGNGLVAHIAFGDPICPDLLEQVHNASARAGITSQKGRHLSLHGRTGFFDQGGIQALSQLGHGRHRHDQPAGSQAGQRSGNLLRHDCARYRL